MEDMAYDMHLRGIFINECYEEWCILEKEIKFNDSKKDTIKIRRLEEIEFEIDMYFEDTKPEDISKEFEWFKTWSPLSKEEKLKLKEKQGGRPKDLHRDKKIQRLRNRYLYLKQKIGYDRPKCLKKLSKETGWAESSIDTYLKR